MARFQIWDRQSTICTPSGEEFTPEQWMARYPWIRRETTVPVISGDPLFNGGFIGELNSIKAQYESRGLVFEEGLTNEEILEAIETYEDALREAIANAASEPSAEERIAAALEYQNLMAE